MNKCNKHNIELECMGGRSAHRSNWYCPECDKEQEETEKNKLSKSKEYPKYDERLTFLAKEYAYNVENNGCVFCIPINCLVMCRAWR